MRTVPRPVRTAVAAALALAVWQVAGDDHVVRLEYRPGPDGPVYESSR